MKPEFPIIPANNATLDRRVLPNLQALGRHVHVKLSQHKTNDPAPAAALCKPNRAAKSRLKPTFLLLKSFPA